MTRTIAIFLGAVTLAVVGLQDTAPAGDYLHEGHHAPRRVHQQHWHGGQGGWYSNHAQQYSHASPQRYSPRYESRVLLPSRHRSYQGGHGGYGYGGYTYGRGTRGHGHSRGHIDVGPLHFGW